jgi:glyoxylase-like metal-dependent hydrolase (beta-lactamase superfamily II)
MVVRRTGGHTRGHSVVRLASGGDRLTFLGDAVFPNHFDRPDWHNAFDHDPEEAVRVRVRLLRELATTREPLVAAHLSFRPSAGWRSPATSFALYRPPGSTDDLLG